MKAKNHPSKAASPRKEEIYNKLVRDRIPEIIISNNQKPVTRILEDTEYKSELEKKLLEEYHEVLRAGSPADRLEELADILEVVSSMGQLEGATLDEIIAIMLEKRKKRGGFSKKIFLEKVVLE